jgi:hypothetical protein
MSIDYDAPAFPTTEAHGFNSGEPGMTLRDYFAGQALAGLLADVPKTMYGTGWMRNVAVASYEIADAALAARGAK